MAVTHNHVAPLPWQVTLVHVAQHMEQLSQQRQVVHRCVIQEQLHLFLVQDRGHGRVMEQVLRLVTMQAVQLIRSQL